MYKKCTKEDIRDILDEIRRQALITPPIYLIATEEQAQKFREEVDAKIELLAKKYIEKNDRI